MTSKKFIFKFNQEEFPLLFNINDNSVEGVILDMLRKGYKDYFNIKDTRELNVSNDVSKLMVKHRDDMITNIDTKTELVKYEVQKILSSLETAIEQDNKNFGAFSENSLTNFKFQFFPLQFNSISFIFLLIPLFQA